MNGIRKKPATLQLHNIKTSCFIDGSDDQSDRTRSSSGDSTSNSLKLSHLISDELINAIYKELKSPASPWDKNISQHSPWLLEAASNSIGDSSPLLSPISPLKLRFHKYSVSKQLNSVGKQGFGLSSNHSRYASPSSPARLARGALGEELSNSQYRLECAAIQKLVAQKRANRRSSKSTLKNSANDIEFFDIEEVSSRKGLIDRTPSKRNVTSRVSDAYSRLKSAVKGESSLSFKRNRSKSKRKIQHLGLTEFNGWEHHQCDWL